MAWPFGVDPFRRLVEDIGLLGPIVATTLLGADVVLTRILSPSLKRSLHLSTGLSWLYLAIAFVRCIVYRGEELDKALAVLGSVGLALALAQTLFVVCIDYVLGRNGRKPLQPMLRYGLLGLVFLVSALLGLRAGGVTTLGVLASGAVVLGGVGAAVAEIFRQVGAGMLVQYARPFDVDDVIFVKSIDRRGKVIEAAWRTTLVRTSDGLEHLIPNSDLVVGVVTNWGHGDRAFRREVFFEGTYDTPPHRVQAAVLAAMVNVQGIEGQPPPTVLVSGFRESGIGYELRYWTRRAEDFERVDAEVRARIWYAFAREGLSFPFPTRTVHLVQATGSDPAQEADAEQLGQVPLFASLDADGRARTFRRGRKQLFYPGEIVFSAGERGKTLYVVLEGEVSVCSGDTRRELFRLGKGEVFGEMALLTGAPRTATVVTVGPVCTFSLDEEAFRALAREQPVIAERLSELISARQVQLVERSSAGRDSEEYEASSPGIVLKRLRELFGLPTSVRPEPRRPERP